MTSSNSKVVLEELGIGKTFQDTLCDMLESSYLFKDFSRQEIEQLAQYMRGYKAPKGAVLFQEGERDSYLVIITSGKAQILKDDGKGKLKEIATVRKGATIGEMSIIDDFPHSATVIAEQDSEIALITKSNIMQISEKHPALGTKLIWQLARQLSARVRQSSGQLVEHLV